MILDRIALILVIIGALNWGGIGLFQFDLVAFAFGGSQAAILARIIYTLVGALHFCSEAGMINENPADVNASAVT